MTCREFVEKLGEFLEADEAERLVAECEAHLAECGDCERFLENYKATIRAMKSLRNEL